MFDKSSRCFREVRKMKSKVIFRKINRMLKKGVNLAKKRCENSNFLKICFLRPDSHCPYI